MLVPYKVLLPKWVYEQPISEDEFYSSVLQYMQRYPHYHVLYVENGFAICERIAKKAGEHSE
ncbi:hypothetical protein [Virgibacillus salexigens]|uniref:hypothetical protein n=1 Tax=Virgibacillus salexigens TaxID=61016 RepID=UPI00190AEF7D|nr:hypothetical protein [Virgibacillus salexigens]